MYISYRHFLFNRLVRNSTKSRRREHVSNTITRSSTTSWTITTTCCQLSWRTPKSSTTCCLRASRRSAVHPAKRLTISRSLRRPSSRRSRSWAISKERRVMLASLWLRLTRRSRMHRRRRTLTARMCNRRLMLRPLKSRRLINLSSMLAHSRCTIIATFLSSGSSPTEKW